MVHQEVETHRGVKFQDAVGSLTLTMDELIFMQDPTKVKANADGQQPKFVSHSWEWQDIETVCAVYIPEDGTKKRKAKRMLQIKSTGSKKLGPQILSLHITEKALQKLMPGLESRLSASRQKKKEAAMRTKAAKKRDIRRTTNKKPPLARRSDAAAQASKKNTGWESESSDYSSSSEEFGRQTRRPAQATATPGMRHSASDNALNRGPSRSTKKASNTGMLHSSSDHHSTRRTPQQIKPILSNDQGQRSRFNRRHTADMTSTTHTGTSQAGSSSKENERIRVNRRCTADMTSTSPSTSGSNDNANAAQREITLGLGPLGYEYDAKEFSLSIPSFNAAAPAQPSARGIPKSGSLNNVQAQRQFPFFRHFGSSKNSVLRTPKPSGQLSQESQPPSARHPARKHLLYFLRTPPPRSQSFSDEASMGPSRKKLPQKKEENKAQKEPQTNKRRHRRLLRRTSSDSKLRAARRQQATLQGTPQKERLNEVIAGRRHRRLLRRTSSDSRLRNRGHEQTQTTEQQGLQEMEAPSSKLTFSSVVGNINKSNLWQMNKLMPGRRALLRKASSDSNIRSQPRQTSSKSLMDNQEWKQHVKFASSDIGVIPSSALGLKTFQLQEKGEDQHKALEQEKGKSRGWKKPQPLDISLKEVPEDTTAEVTGGSKEVTSAEKQQTVSRSAQKASAIRLKSRDFEIAQRYFDSQAVAPAEVIVEDDLPPEMIEIRPRVMTDQTSAAAVAWFTGEVRETSNKLPGIRPTQPMGLGDGTQSFVSFASSEFTVSDAGSFFA